MDLAREHGLSARAVRNYEGKGVLPKAARTRHGYRVQTPAHVQDARPAHQLRRCAYPLRQISP